MKRALHVRAVAMGKVSGFVQRGKIRRQNRRRIRAWEHRKILRIRSRLRLSRCRTRMLSPIRTVMIRSQTRDRRARKPREKVLHANLIMSIEVHRPGNGSDVKIIGLADAIKLSDQETQILMGLVAPLGGMPTPL